MAQVKHFIRLAQAAVFLLLCCLCLHPGIYSASAAENFDNITIGVLLDLSGPGSLNGAAAFRAVRLAAEETNAQGGIKGRKIQIAVFDTKGQRDLLLSGAGRLQHEQGAVLLLGPTNPANVLILRRYAESSRIPLILIQGLEPLLRFTGIKTSWTFSTTINFDAELKALFSYFRKRQYNSLGGLLDNTELIRKIALWIKGYAPEYGMKISCLGSFNPNQEDLSMKLAYLSRCEPDIAVLWSGWTAAPLVQSNLKVIDVPIALSHQIFFRDPRALDLPVGSLVYSAVPPVLFWQAVPRSSQSYFLVRRFIMSWGSEFQDMSPEQQLAAGQAWDGLRLACRAISLSHRLTHQAVRASLEKNVAPFAGVIGVFSPSKRDHSGLKAGSLLLLRCMGSRWSPIAR